MPAFRPSLLDIFNALVALLPKIDILQTDLTGVARESTSQAIQVDTFNTQADLNNGTFGLLALHNQLTALAAQVAALGTAIGLDFTTAIATITTDVKTAPAPAWYTSPPAGIAASDVWSYINPGDTQNTGGRLSEAGTFAVLLGTFATFVSPDNPYFRLAYDYPNDGQPAPPFTTPDFDLSLLLAGDTVGSFLNRIDTQGNVFTLQASGFWTSDTLFTGYGYWLCTISAADLAAIKRDLALVSSSSEPPIWPGVAKVTLGAPVALATGLTLTALMDGVIVTVTAVPPGTASYNFDGTLSYTFIGALSFVSDRGDQEFPQGIGFQSAVYSPKEMARAAGVKVRTKPGIVGTIRPWTIT